MKILTTFLVSLLLINVGFGQTKKISGYTFNDQNQKRISGVYVSPTFKSADSISDENGKFCIIVPKTYFDTLVFTHPDYYPYIERVNRSSNIKLNFIPLLPRILELDTVFYKAMGNTKRVSGEVMDAYRDEPVPNVSVHIQGMGKVGESEKSGRFSIIVPKDDNNLIFTHHDFTADTITIRKKPYSYKIYLDRIVFREADTLWKSKKNIIAISINELLNLAIGLRYQRFLSLKHTIGVYTSTYLSSKLYGYNVSPSNYTGFKVALNYRYYEKRKFRKSQFLEFKIIGGYFDFSNLMYISTTNSEHQEKVQEDFFSIGIGGGLGWTSRISKSSNALFTITAGMQVFPMNVPKNIESQNYGSMKVHNIPWYLHGPGSALELKFALGGIF